MNKTIEEKVSKHLTEQELKCLRQILDLPGYPIPFHAMDNPLVEKLTNIIRALAK
jgi:hypothetical protein